MLQYVQLLSVLSSQLIVLLLKLCSEHTSYAQDGIFCGNSHLWITDLWELSLIFFINALCIALNCGITLFAKENKEVFNLTLGFNIIITK